MGKIIENCKLDTSHFITFDRVKFLEKLSTYRDETIRAKTRVSLFRMTSVFTFDRRVKYVDELSEMLSVENYNSRDVLIKIKEGIDEYCQLVNADLFNLLMRAAEGLFLYQLPGVSREMAMFV